MKYFYGAFELCIVFSNILSFLPFTAGSSDTQKIYPSEKTSCGPENFPECRWAVFKQLLINDQCPISIWWITINDVSQISIFHNLSLECVKLDFRGRFLKKQQAFVPGLSSQQVSFMCPIKWLSYCLAKFLGHGNHDHFCHPWINGSTHLPKYLRVIWWKPILLSFSSVYGCTPFLSAWHQ